MSVSKVNSPLIPLSLLLLGALVLWLSPAEARLGEGVKYVYVHVGLIWAGMAGLLIAGGLGAMVAIGWLKRWPDWIQTIAWVGLGLYTAGLLMSRLAAEANWGGMFWQEPRTRTALQVITLGLIVQVIGSWEVWPRLVGSLRFGLVGFLAWTSLATPLFLHPPNAIRASSSTAIQASALALFLLWCLVGAWVALYWQSKRGR